MDPSRPITNPEPASPFEFLARIIFIRGGKGEENRRGSWRQTPRSLAVWFPRVSSLSLSLSRRSPPFLPFLCSLPRKWPGRFEHRTDRLSAFRTLNDLNPSKDQRSAMSAALRVLSAWPYHATRTMRTGLTRYDVSTTLFDASRRSISRTREASSLWRVIRLTFCEDGYMRRKESLLWLNFIDLSVELVMFTSLMLLF